eukprot:SAG31_NODE_1473_length_8207_cov_2.716330_4_plen_116_part_00
MKYSEYDEECDGHHHQHEAAATAELPWHQMVLEFTFDIYSNSPSAQLSIIRALDAVSHGEPIVVPKLPSGFSRFELSVFGSPYMHPYYRILSLGLGDLECLHNDSMPAVDPRIDA